MMDAAQKLRRTLAEVFGRKGGDGRYTRLFENLEPSSRDALLELVPLGEGELPVIGSTESPQRWLFITTHRIVWRAGGDILTLPTRNVFHAAPDRSDFSTGTRWKKNPKSLEIETIDHKQWRIPVEGGPPLAGVWSILLNLGARNRHAKT